MSCLLSSFSDRPRQQYLNVLLERQISGIVLRVVNIQIIRDFPKNCPDRDDNEAQTNTPDNSAKYLDDLLPEQLCSIQSSG